MSNPSPAACKATKMIQCKTGRDVVVTSATCREGFTELRWRLVIESGRYWRRLEFAYGISLRAAVNNFLARTAP